VNEALRGLLAVGTRLAYDGQWWQVAELDGPHVLLAGPAGVRGVSAGHLLAVPSTRLPGAPGDPVEGAGPELARLDEAEMAGLRERIAHVQEVRTGFRRGCAELAAGGEPRPEYAPGVPLLARYAAKAAETGVGVSTLRRWVKDFGERGPAGLSDDRRRRQQPLHAGAADESGRGLDLVHELTDARWGWYHAPSGPGKCVWAEFPIPSHSGRRRTAVGRIPPVSGMQNGTESGRLRPGRGHERPDLNPIRR
jgi:hypothetical protein